MNDPPVIMFSQTIKISLKETASLGYFFNKAACYTFPLQFKEIFQKN